MKKTLPALTSLRFFAAAAIVLEHSRVYFHIGDGFASRHVLVQGVTFFFVLSGFILTYSHGNLSGAYDSTRFVWSRIARVWPAHAFTMLVFHVFWVGYFQTGYDPTLEQTLRSLTLTQAWGKVPAMFSAYNGVAWTLSVEMFFYVLFPLLIHDFARTWRLKLVGVAVFVPAALWMAFLTQQPENTPFADNTTAGWVYIWPPVHLVEFVYGMVAAFAWRKYKDFNFGKAAINIGEVLAIGLLLGASAWVPYAGWFLEGRGIISPTIRYWVTVSAAAPFYAIAFFLLASGRGHVSALLSFRPLVLLGEISFSIYLIHQIIERALSLHPQWFAQYSMPVQFAGYWLFTIAASYLLWQLVEKPSQRLLMSWFKARPAEAVPVSSLTSAPNSSGEKNEIENHCIASVRRL
jgi:peptidoglycan/LPS O-acetylase OafA/YrhL